MSGISRMVSGISDIDPADMGLGLRPPWRIGEAPANVNVRSEQKGQSLRRKLYEFVEPNEVLLLLEYVRFHPPPHSDLSPLMSLHGDPSQNNRWMCRAVLRRRPTCCGLSSTKPPCSRLLFWTHLWLTCLIMPQAPSARERKEREASLLTFQHSDWAKAGLLFERVVIVVILINVTAFALSTDEVLMNRVPGLEMGVVLVELVTVGLFTAEYLLRLATCGVHDRFKGFTGLIRHMLSPFALVDLLSIAPFYFDLVSPRDDLPAVQFVRVLRLLRVLVTGEYSGAFRNMSRAVSKNSTLLVTSGFAGLAVWVVLGSMFYLA